MKITNIERDGNIYTLTFEPNFIERLFNIKKKIKRYKDTLSTYTFGGGHVYVDEDGRDLGNNFGYGSNIREKIDRWRNKF